MIERIDRITNFGVFKNFTCNHPDFKKYNLIYGWNYSGKTTLSRIFRCIELEELHIDFSDSEFELTDNQNNKIRHNKLDNTTSKFRIFNTDFIDSNLYWDNQEANPIFILGEEDIESQNQIKILAEEINNLKDGKKKKSKEKSDSERDLEKKLTDKARELDRIKPPYDKRKLRNILENIQSDLEKYCLNETVLHELLKTLNTPPKEKISEISLEILDEEKLDEIKELLDKTAISQTIERLEKNPKLNNWVRKGLDLHVDKTKCEFCSSKLPENLLQIYEKHFSEEYENLLNELNKAIQDLNRVKLINSFPDNKRIYPRLEERYKTVKSNFENSINEYNRIIDDLAKLLKAKINNPFKKLANELIPFNVIGIHEGLKDFNEIRIIHNNICDNFQNEQENAFEKLELHYAYEFDNENKYYNALNGMRQLKNEIKKINEEIAKKEEEIHKIESQLSDVGKAADKINQDLHNIFGREHIKLDATDENKFKILRDGREAKNLSEGEKTAIAFSYFLTRLEDKETDISEATIFIDDPISSLDSNHLYNTFAIIKANLENCDQLFISTHNLEFFNLIKDWFTKMKGNKSKCCYYLIERITSNGNEISIISELPSFLLKYRSEYHYLFYKIKLFSTNPTTEFESLYQLPNIIRRFLEAFIGFKYSKGLKDGLEMIISDKSDRIKIDKFVNNFSHQRDLSRSLVFTDVNECKRIVDIVLGAVKRKDGEHYDVLEDIYNGVVDK